MDIQSVGDAYSLGWQTSNIDYIARAKALAPRLTEAGPRIDAARELPDDIQAAMQEAGMFRLLLPRSVGGAELDPLTYVQCVEAIASGDGSAGWCMNQGSGCSMSAAYLEPDASAEVFADPHAVLAWGQGPGARAERVPGGWMVTGKWLFASGSRHATWLGCHSFTYDADGTARCHPDGRPWEATMLVRREQAIVTDTWHVMGLRGTGSDQYAVSGLFVPDRLTLTRDLASERRHPGLLYRFTTGNIYASGFGSVALGIARGILDAFTRLARDKTPALTTTRLADSQVIQSQLAISEAKLASARLFLHDRLRDARETLTTSETLTLDQRAGIRLASTFAIHQAREVVDFAYHEAGATAIFESNVFERRFRDIHSVCQQVQGRATHFETIGQHLLGLPVSMRWL